MKKRILRLRFALLLSVVLMATAAVQTTLAYIVVETPPLVNTFAAPQLPAPTDKAVSLQVRKSVVSTGGQSIGPEGFRFSLINTATGEELILTTDEAGLATASLTFTAADVGQTYHYRLAEVNDGRENVTYSDAVYHVQIAVGLDEATDELTFACALNGVKADALIAEFENLYRSEAIVPLPPTGDSTNPWVYAALLAASCMGLLALKKRRTTV